ncbi:MAG: hypothetical protein IT292_07250, partial [Deltaproteobacteria bacterium]|nr:hypothetical protein [Deltaproteobacteria bacterium]
HSTYLTSLAHNHNANYITSLSHNHTADYATSSHNHTANYAATTHAHSTYLTSLAHDHNANYITSLAHNHTADYATSSHNHTANYAATTHAHSTYLTSLAHNHDANYLTAAHSHSAFSSLTINGASGNTFIVDTPTFIVDASNNRVGIGLTAPTSTLQVISSGTMAIPNAANPTVTAAGQISVDTSATSGNMLRFYGDAERALPAYLTKSFLLPSPNSGSDYPVWRVPYAITIRNIYVLTVGGTNVVGGLDETDANGANAVAIDADITGSAGTNASDDGTLSNPSLDAGDYLFWHTTSVSGTPTSVTVTVNYTVNPVN